MGHLMGGGLFLRQSVTSSTHPCRRTKGDGDGEDVLSEWHLRDEGNDSFPTSFREGQQSRKQPHRSESGQSIGHGSSNSVRLRVLLFGFLGADLNADVQLD